jgi:hypothetical protein
VTSNPAAGTGTSSRMTCGTAGTALTGTQPHCTAPNDDRSSGSQRHSGSCGAPRWRRESGRRAADHRRGYPTRRAPLACACSASAEEGRCGSLARAWASNSSTVTGVPRPTQVASGPVMSSRATHEDRTGTVHVSAPPCGTTAGIPPSLPSRPGEASWPSGSMGCGDQQRERDGEPGAGRPARRWRATPNAATSCSGIPTCSVSPFRSAKPGSRQATTMADPPHCVRLCLYSRHGATPGATL